MTKTPSRRSTSLLTRSYLWIAVVAFLQIMCGSFFVYELAATVFGWRTEPVSWTWREALEIMAVIGLILGMILGAMLMRTLVRQRRQAQERLRLMSTEFYAVVQDRFADWGLTPSERDVAFFMLRGLSNSEIAGLRNTSEGTIKAQSTAVFRKADVTGRSQLLSSFIEDLLVEESVLAVAGQVESIQAR